MARIKSDRPPIRLRDVAQMAGVSVNTASRALNDKPDVNTETRARVRAIAERLGYSPNMLARSLVSGLSHTIGLVVTDCTDPYYATLIRATEEVMSGEGFGMLLVTSNEDVEKERQGLMLLAGRRVDGLLLTAVDVEAPHVRHLLDADDLPVVLLSRRPESYQRAFVGIDNLDAARTAIGHLWELGHRRFALVARSGPASSGRERLAGLHEELAARGSVPGHARLHVAEPSLEGGRAAVSWFLDLEPRPTAVVTYNDSQAIGLIKGLQEAGLSVPRDVSVIGFDDIAMASLVQPPLTTIAQPIDRIGRLGAEMLIRRVRGDTGRIEPVVLPCHLVARASTGPPRDDH